MLLKLFIIKVLVLWDGELRQLKFCSDKQQCNNVKSFSVYVLALEKVENCYECFKCIVWT